MAGRKKPQIFWGDKGDDLVRMIAKALMHGGAKKVKKAEKVAGKAVGQMVQQGKFARAEQLSARAVEANRLRKTLAGAASKAEAKVKSDKVLKSQERTLRATRIGDAVESKGSKIVRGKETPVGKKKAGEIVSQGKKAGTQRAKGNANRKAEQDAMRAAARSAKGAERVAAMRRLRAHEAKHGRFK